MIANPRATAVPCRCGCGSTVYTPDEYGREVVFAMGHQNRNSEGERTVRDLVLELGPIQAGRLHALVKRHYSYQGLLSALRRLRDRGEIENIRGLGWCRPGTPGEAKVRSTEKVACECGCGTMILRWDEWRHERRFVLGHRSRRAG